VQDGSDGCCQLHVAAMQQPQAQLVQSHVKVLGKFITPLNRFWSAACRLACTGSLWI
jgi:hypothetical protein